MNTLPRWLRSLAAIAMVFGVLTVLSGGRTLFGDDATRAAAGQIVDFVLWFNFLAGFVYIATGWGLWRATPWARHLATALAVGTGLVALAFGVHVISDGAYETRTVAAMLLRLGFWVMVALLVARPLSGPVAPRH